MISKYPSIDMKRREPPKRAVRIAMISKGPALLLRELKTGCSRFPDCICFGKILWMPLISWCCAAGLPPTTKPKMAMRATRMGKIAVKVLNASPDAKFITQSLLNLAMNCLIGWAFFSACSTGLEDVTFWTSSFGFDSFVWVAIIPPPTYHPDDDTV